MSSLSENAAEQFAMSPRWRNPPVRRGMTHLMEWLAALVALAILLTFFQVVRGAVLHGERLHLAMGERSAAMYRCNSLADAGAAETCRRQLIAPAIAKHTPTVALVSAAPPKTKQPPAKAGGF